MFEYLKGLYSAANLAFYYRGVADRSYDDPAQMREALTRAVTATQSSRPADESQNRIAA